MTSSNGHSRKGQKCAGVIARVSTRGQLDNTSPEEQLRRGREYCHTKGYEVVIERIEAISGVFVLARSVFNEYLDMAANGQLDVIVFDIPDRAGRGDAIAKIELLAQLNGAQVEYAASGRDVSTLEGLALKATDQLVSGIERMNIRRRTMGAKQALARQGRFIATSYRPFGYNIITERDARGRITSCRLEIREDEARIIQQIFEWCVYEKMSTYAIARRLTDSGTPTQKDTSHVRNRKYEGLWVKSTVYDILTRETYVGIWRYGKRQVKRMDEVGRIRTHTTMREVEETIAVPVPAIIEKNLWEATQLELAERRQRGNKPSKYPYLLRSKIRCALCQGLYQGSAKQRKTKLERYYRCGHGMAEYRPHRCTARALNSDKVEADVWNKVCEIMRDRKTLFEYRKTQKKEAQKARRLIEGSIASGEIEIQKAEAKLERFLDLFGSGGMTKDAYLKKEQAISREIDKHRKEQAKLSGQLREYPIINPEDEAILQQYQAEIAKRMHPDLPFEERRKLLDILHIECLYDDGTGKLVISGALGEHTLTVRSERHPPARHPAL